MFKTKKKNKAIINNKDVINKDCATNSYRFKQILNYKKKENHEHYSDVDLTIKYDIVKPEVQYKNFYESWIEKNIGSEDKNKIIDDNLKSKTKNHK